MPTDPGFWSLVLLQGITLAVLLIAWAGLLIPVFPGLLIMWLATLMYAVASARGRPDELDRLDALRRDHAAGDRRRHRRQHHHRRQDARPSDSLDAPSCWRIVAGLVASIFFTPLIGILASPLTLYAAEARRLHDRKLGLESARLYMIAWGWAFAAVFGIGGLIILTWLIWAFV